jgi:hypothetical protein
MLPPAFVGELASTIARVTPSGVLTATQTYLAPPGLHTVLVGDASLIHPAVGVVGAVEVFDDR